MSDTCACSGVRSCLICEKTTAGRCSSDSNRNSEMKTLKFCFKCQKLSFEKTESLSFLAEDCKKHQCSEDIVSGITVIENFITKSEEEFMLTEIEKFPWQVSQSGRKKQDFGPKVNFKKKKLKLGNFCGLPKFSQFIVKRIHHNAPQLKDFHPVELCNLDYCPERGASIDPHIDDTWLWGERLITVNLLSDTILTLTDSKQLYEIQIPMPRLSLVILQGEARHTWMHGIKRGNIKCRRLAVTLRELSKEFLSGDNYTQTGKHLLEIASSYNGQPTSA